MRHQARCWQSVVVAAGPQSVGFFLGHDDATSITAVVPEPGTLALLVLALGVIALRRRAA